MTVLSLFSGAGGLDLGLVKAGNPVIWANDIDAHAVETYKKNIGSHIICADIKDIGIAGLPATDVVVGGFPCQGFSQANLQRAVDDERNKSALPLGEARADERLKRVAVPSGPIRGNGRFRQAGGAD